MAQGRQMRIPDDVLRNLLNWNVKMDILHVIHTYAYVSRTLIKNRLLAMGEDWLAENLNSVLLGFKQEQIINFTYGGCCYLLSDGLDEMHFDAVPDDTIPRHWEEVDEDGNVTVQVNEFLRFQVLNIMHERGCINYSRFKSRVRPHIEPVLYRNLRRVIKILVENRLIIEAGCIIRLSTLGFIFIHAEEEDDLFDDI